MVRLNSNQPDVHVLNHIVPQILDHYHYSLIENDKARDYLNRQYGIGDDVIQKFGIGFSSRNLGKKLFTGSYTESRVLRGSLCRLKVYKSSGHETFRGCVTFPVKNNGDLIGIYGERIERTRRGAQKSYWCPINSICLFQHNDLNGNHAWLVSNPLYAISTAKYLLGNVVASGGIKHITQAGCGYLSEQGISNISLLLNRHDMKPEWLGILAQHCQASGINISHITSTGGAHVTTQ